MLIKTCKHFNLMAMPSAYYDYKNIFNSKGVVKTQNACTYAKRFVLSQNANLFSWGVIL